MQWRAARSPGIDFAVWTLLQQGLHVPPFDLHATDRNHSTAGGMTADGWRSWVVELAQWAEAHPNVQPAVQDIATRTLTPAVADELRATWADYTRTGLDWERLVVPWLREWSSPDVIKEFWSRVAREDADRNAQVEVHLVRYVGPATMRATERSILVATGDWMTSFAQFSESLFAAIAEPHDRVPPE